MGFGTVAAWRACFPAVAIAWGAMVSSPMPVSGQSSPLEGPAPDGAAPPIAPGQTKQIHVEAPDPKTRAAFLHFADSVDEGLRAVLHDREPWSTPIAIEVKGGVDEFAEDKRTALPYPIELLPTGFSLRLAVRMHGDMSYDEITRELIRLLLYERMLRPYAAEPDAFPGERIAVPEWLVHGFEQYLKYRRDGRPSDLYAGIVKSRQVLSIDRILTTDPAALDPVSTQVYGASAAALVAALLDQQDERGPEYFRQTLSQLATVPGGDIGPLLRQNFPSLRESSDALEKWWSLQIAQMGQMQAMEFLSVEQTETLLEEALAIRLTPAAPRAKGGLLKFLPHLKPDGAFAGRLHDYDEFLGRDGCEAALEQCDARLRSLGQRCHPLYRTVLLRYQRAVQQLVAGKKFGLRDELKSIDQAREGVRLTARRVEDYLNYYEATGAAGKSQTYRQYRELREKFDRERHPARDDRVSKYLDALEAEFE